jgi:serine-type D-Ala-D-Ala carboxypeptidase/endopeptidase (penicillin-binding protein 4)
MSLFIFHKIAILIVAVSFLIPGITNAQQRSIQSLKKELERFSGDPVLKNASWGFMAINAETGKEIASFNSTLALSPASTQKVVTTLTALALLGSDYRYQTLLQHDGSIKGNLLQGNLYIQGSGDPTLGATQLHDSLALERVFASWLRDLRAAGIEQMEGDIIADGSYFDNHMIPPRWIWVDMGNYYGAGAHALTVHENMYTVYFDPGPKIGDPARVIRTLPEIHGMEYINNVATGPRGSGDQVYIYGAPYQNIRWLTGTVPLGERNFGVRGSIPDPGHYIAWAFQQYLIRSGIAVKGNILTHRDTPNLAAESKRVIISRWYSPHLEIIAARTNLHSVNTYAENLIKTLGRIHGQDGSFSSGAQVITSFWKDKGMDIDGLRIHDGSGLALFNNITAQQLTAMLAYAASNETLFLSLTKGFPVAGRSGSLATLLRGTRSEGVLMAKSGFLSNVRAYTGYTRCRNGHLIAFTIIVNNYAGTAAAMRSSMMSLMDALSNVAL